MALFRAGESTPLAPAIAVTRDRQRVRAGSWLASVDRLLLPIAALLLVLGCWQLERFPAPWFDEGIHLQVPANLASGGPYAARAADGTLDYAPALGVGPTVMLPVALLMKVGGVSLASARLVPVLYLLAATLLLFVVARALFGRAAALGTLALALTMPALDWLETGRQLLGELPALTFLLAGGLLATRARSTTSVVGAGIVLGLALVTKGQYVLVLPATLVLLAAVDLRVTHHRTLRWHLTLLVAALATWASWLLALLLTMGDGQVGENLRLLRESSGGALLVFAPDRIVAALRVLLGPGTFMLVVPALLFGLHAVVTARGERRFALLALWLFACCWLGWFAFASIAWPRYAFAGLALTAVFAGGLLASLATRVDFSGARGRRPARLAALAGAALVVAVVALGGWRTVAPVFRAQPDDAAVFAARVDADVPPGATIAGWEPEIVFLTGRDFQTPPPGSLDQVVRATWAGDPRPDFSARIAGDYLVVGEFGRWVGVYQRAIDSGEWIVIERVGAYELYRRAP